MRINHNIAALNTYNKLSANTKATSASLEKLSSGLKINRAGDNAAGLAISEKMRGQISGLDTASSNASDGISLIQTAEGALAETHSILQRMRELAVQASNDTNTTADREEMQKEIAQLTSEVTRTSTDTEFNTKKLLDGSAGIKTTMNSEKVGTADANWMSIVGGSGETKTGTIGISAGTAATGATQTIAFDTATAGARSITVNGTTVNFTAVGTDPEDATALATALSAVADDLGITVDSTTTPGSVIITNKEVGSVSALKITADVDSYDADGTAYNSSTVGVDASITAYDDLAVDEPIAATSMVASGNTIKVVSGKYQGLEIKLNGDVMDSIAANNDANFTIDSNNSLTLHIGANEGQNTTLSLNNMDAESLGVHTLDLTTQEGAEVAITTIDNAITTVSSERAKLGAMQNRLEHTINNLGTSSENLTAAESQIRDVDMAKEMTEFTKNNILSQAAQSMLAQANQQPQNVLQLLQ